MAQHKSALKRQRQAEKKTLVNKSARSTLKTLTKKVDQAVKAKDTDLAKQALTRAMKAYDKAAARGIVHVNNASRTVSRLSIRVSKINASK